MMSHPKRDLAVIRTAAFLRSFGVGLLGVILGIYLFRIGRSSLTVGIVVGAGLAGSAATTAVMSFAADYLGRKRSLLVLSSLTAVGGLALAYSWAMPLLLFMALAFVGMLNGTGTDRSPSYAIEQAVIPGLAPDAKRTWNLAFYNALIDGGGSLGALAAGLPIFFQHRLGLPLLAAYKTLFLGSGAASSRRPEKYSPNLLRCFPWTLLGEVFSPTLSSRTGFFDVLALLNTSSDSCSLQSMY